MNSLTALAVLLPLVLALLAAPAALLAGAVKPRYAAPVGAVFAALAALATLWVWGVGGAVDVPWSPTYDLRFAVELDGLAVLYALLATEIDFAVLGYSSRYLPLHLEHGGRPESDGAGFFILLLWGFMLLFMGSMVGLAVAQDLILVFVFRDLMAIASYCLIGFDCRGGFQSLCAHGAARHQGDGGILQLGALILYAAYGTFSIPDVAQRWELTGWCGSQTPTPGCTRPARRWSWARSPCWQPRSSRATRRSSTGYS